MAEPLPFLIQHRKSFFCVFWENITSFWPLNSHRPKYYETMITTYGIILTRRFRKSLLIPWGEIECLDLSGLKYFSYKWLIELPWWVRILHRLAGQTRFFLLMSSNNALLDSGNFKVTENKIWRAGVNVLAIQEIEPQSAQLAFQILTDMSCEHNIKIDGIVLDYWEQ